MTPASGKLALPKGYIMFKKIMATTAIAQMLAAPMPASANHGWSGDREARSAERAEQRAAERAERRAARGN